MADENVDLLVAAARKQFRRGVVPVRKNYLRGPNCACLVGAAALAAGATSVTQPVPVERLCQTAYGVSELELAGLTEGFDGTDDEWVDKGSYAYQQGRTVATEVFRRAAA